MDQEERRTGDPDRPRIEADEVEGGDRAAFCSPGRVDDIEISRRHDGEVEAKGGLSRLCARRRNMVSSKPANPPAAPAWSGSLRLRGGKSRLTEYSLQVSRPIRTENLAADERTLHRPFEAQETTVRADEVLPRRVPRQVPLHARRELGGEVGLDGAVWEGGRGERQGARAIEEEADVDLLGLDSH